MGKECKRLLVFLLLVFHCGNVCGQEAAIGEEAEWIGKQIFRSECGSNPDKLVWWNEGETFASLGIGHFIWYPQEEPKVFTETFPRLVAFLKAHGVVLPVWLEEARGCVWANKAAFEGNGAENRVKREELRRLLVQTMGLQCLFLQEQFAKAVPEVLEGLSEAEQAAVHKKIDALMTSKRGRYALLDYTHFKGQGTELKERYCGQGWGLKQVLEAMEVVSEAGGDPVAAFVCAAEQVLRARVAKAPEERRRHEERWLKGWLARVRAYRQ